MSQTTTATQTTPQALQKAPPFQVQRAARIDMTLPIWQAIKKAYCKDASDGEFEVLCRVVEVTNLDIFNREIYWIPGIGTYISYKGWWALAMRTDVFEGFERHVFKWIDKDGVINTERRGKLFSCTATGWRNDMRFPVVVEALFDEWYIEKNPNWKNRGEHMLSKQAEKLALARLFPVSGVIDMAKIDDDALPMIKLHDGSFGVPGSTTTQQYPLPPGATPETERSTVSAGSADKQEVPQAHGAPPAPEKPASFTAPARARAELFTLINEGLKVKADTAPNMLAFAFERKVTNDEVQKIDDIEALNKAYVRLSDLVEGAKRDRAATK